jgi:parvulin-like peptidyl-prolyl isomerase
VLATVNGEKIYQNDVEGFSAVMALMSSMKYGELDANTKAQIDNSMLIRFIDIESIKTYFKEQKKDVITKKIKDEVDKNADEILKSIKEQESDAQKLHITKELLIMILEGEQYDAAYREVLAEKDPVKDEEISAYYEKNLAQYTREAEERQVSHILMGDKEHTAEDRAAAEEVRAKVLAGEDFAALAKENSKDSGSAEKGGDVGLVRQDGTMVAPFEEAVFALAAAGDVSGLVETDYGFHIIKLVDVLAPGQKTL